jgi:hypothetical protein
MNSTNDRADGFVAYTELGGQFTQRAVASVCPDRLHLLR